MVFTCAAVRVVHFELVSGRTIEETAAAVVRFGCRRGIPALVLSDNAPEFEAVGAVLRRAGRGVARPEAPGARSWGELEWEHYPARAPHFGGAVESVVKLCKSALGKILGDREMTDLDLCQALVLAEYVVNARPLGEVSADFRDPVPLTGNHFLGGLAADLVLAGPVGSADAAGVYFRQQERIKQRWDEALSTLLPPQQVRRLWKSADPPPAVGDVVVALDVPHLAHRAVSLGRIIKLYPGADGIPRRADVLVRGKLYHRAVHSLAPLLRGGDNNSGSSAAQARASGGRIGGGKQIGGSKQIGGRRRASV